MKTTTGRQGQVRATRIAIAVAAAFAPWAHGQTPPPNQMPDVALRHGSATLNAPVGTYQQIDQASQRAIYEGSMTMGSNAHLHLNHATFGRSGIGLFKDVSGSLSQIFGRLTSNGQVFISNPNGVLFGSTARVDVGGLLATTLSTNADEFMAGGSRINWVNSGGAGSVTNRGEIITANGYAALAGPQVSNEGVIRANMGRVALAAGDRVALDLIGDGLISISVEQGAVNALASNTGMIEADSGTVLLTARSANALLDTVVNAGGAIRATFLVERNGEIVLDGGNAGTVMVAGSHEAGSASLSGAAITVDGTLASRSGGISVGAQGAVQVNGGGRLDSAGALTLETNGSLNVIASSAGDATVQSQAGQTIRAQSLTVTSQGGKVAQISNTATGDQAISVTGGAPGSGLTVQNLGGPTGQAFISNFSQGKQRIEVTNADHITINGIAGSAGINSPSGEQTVSITGNGANAIRIGSEGAAGGSIISGGSQTIIAGTGSEQGSITLTNGAANLAFASLVNTGSSVAATQSVSTSGTLAIKGGTAPSQSASAGIFQNRAAQQKITATNIHMNGGPSGSGNGAFINATAGGNQLIRVSGDLLVTGGSGGTNNRAGIVTSGDQTITGNPAIVLRGGDGGGASSNSNNVFVQAGSADTTVQTINARSVELRSGAGVDAAATLNGARQVISTTGNVSLYGGSGLGSLNGARIGGIGGTALGPTNLTLTVGGDLLLHGGFANGVSLGSSGPSTQSNTIAVAADNIILRSDGAGARIGSSGQVPASLGSIALTATESLDVGAGTAIRANGPITLTASGLTNAGTITNGGAANTPNIILNADSFSLAGGTINGGAAAVILRPRTGSNSFGIEADGQTTLTNADIASIQTSNFVVFGSGLGSFTGHMIVGDSARVEGAGRSLAFLRSGPGAITIGTQGVGTTGDVIISSTGGSIASNGGLVSGDEVQLRATSGIGALGASVKTDANALSILNSTFNQPVGLVGNAFVAEANDVTLKSTAVAVGGMNNTANNFVNGSLDFSAGGNVTVLDTAQSIGRMNVEVGGALTLAASGGQDAILRSDNGGQTVSAQSVNILAQDIRTAQIVSLGGEQKVTASSINLGTHAGGGFAEIRNSNAAAQTITVSGDHLTLKALGGGTATIFAGGDQTINMTGAAPRSITLGDNLAQGQSTITSNGEQKILGYADITLTGGSGTASPSVAVALIQANNPTRTQQIEAHNLTLANSSAGGNNSVAAVLGAKQTIRALGDVTLTAYASGGTLPGVRIGGLPGPGASATGTDLTLTVDGDVILNGSSTTANNGVGIGSTAATPPGAVLPNRITISADDVILNAGAFEGSGARIGASGAGSNAPGEITITARGKLELNGAAIRTQGDVTINAASISEGNGNGRIIAGALTTTSVGNTTLTGPNQVSTYNGTSDADLSFANSGPLTVAGVDAAGNASLTNKLGGVNVAGPWHSATADISSDAGIFQSGGGSIVAGTLTTNSAGATSLTGANQVGSFKGSSGFGADLTLNNSGALTVTGLSVGNNATLTNKGDINVTGLSSAFGEMDVATTAGNLTLTSSLSSGRAMELDIGGKLTLSANGAQTAQLITNNGGQTIRAQAVEVVARNGGFAAITNIAGGEQRITVSGAGTSAGLDVHTRSGGGRAEIFQQATGFAQTIAVRDADHINVNAAGPSSLDGTGALIGSMGGVQTVSITGSGANAVTIGSLGARGDSRIAGGEHQVITAGADRERGSITIVGTDVNGRLSGFVSTPVGLGGTQTISTAGTFRVQGGRAAQASGFQSGAFHNGSGEQTVTAGRIELEGGPEGTNNGAFISALGGGVPANAGAQTVNVTGDIQIAGGAGGNASISGPATRLQQIRANNISVTNAAAGGNNTGGFISGGRQEIHAAGDVTLTARETGGDLPGVRIGGGSGVATDLKLYVGGDLTLTAGAVNNGVGIGSSASGTPLSNNIYIETGGSVVLNAGTAANAGVRIGSSSLNGTAGGNIEIRAGGNIELNGTSQPSAIRTLDTVTLRADRPGGYIAQNGNGLIVAGSLVTTSHGDTDLGGANNSVSRFNGSSSTGSIALNNTGALNVTGLSAHNATLTNAGDVTVSGPWTSFAASITTLGAGSDLTVSSAVTSSGPMHVDVAGDIAVTAGAGQNALLRSFGGQTISGRSLAVNSNGGIARVWNTGPSAQTISVSGGAGVDVQALAAGGLAEISADAGGNQTISVLNGHHINVNGAQGSAGIFNSGGTQTISVTGSGANAITLGAAGSLGPSIVGGGTQKVTAGAPGQAGSITIVGGNGDATFTGFSSGQVIGGTQTLSTSGALRISGGEAPSQPVNGFATGLFHNGSGEQKVAAASLEMNGGASGANNVAIIISSGGGGVLPAGNQVIDVAAGNVSLAGGSGGSGNSALIVSFADQSVSARNVALQGGADGAGNGAFVNSNVGRDQLLTVTESIRVTGGSGGAGNRAGLIAGMNQTIAGNPDILLEGGAGGVVGNGNYVFLQSVGDASKLQRIDAGRIELRAGTGTDSSATLIAARQEIVTLGDVAVLGSAGVGTLNGARIGGLPGTTLGPTNLVLDAGGNVLVHGGVGSGASIGTAGASTQANNISITARDVTLRSDGAGARIGSSGQVAPAAGSIAVSATGDIDVGTGTVLRSAGQVSLAANQAGGSISQGGNGVIIAGSLVTISHGDTSLAGQNQVAAFNGNSTNGSISLNNTVPLDVTGLNAAGDATINNIGTVTVSGPWIAGGTSTITVASDILLNADLKSGAVVLDAKTGAIKQDANAKIEAESLAAKAVEDVALDGTNKVAKVAVSSETGDISLKTESPVLTLASVALPGALMVNHIGEVAVSGEVSALSHDIRATQNVTIGSADAQQATWLHAPGHIVITTPGAILVRGSDTTAGAGSAVTAGGELTFNAGSVSLVGGSAALSPVLVRGANGVKMGLSGDLRVVGGAGSLSPAILASGRNVDLTVGGALSIDGGQGHLSLARVQTELRDGVIHLTFPNLGEGGYFVNGREGDNHHGQTGFFADYKPARVGRTLLLEYGD